MINRSKLITDKYKQKTGVDVVELWKSKNFADKKNPYDDEKSRFVKFLLDETGYSNQLPKSIEKDNNYLKLFRGVCDSKYTDVTGEEQVKNFLNGEMDISGSRTSAHGRGLYFSVGRSGAERYANANEGGQIIEACLLDNANMLDDDILKKEKAFFKNHYSEFGKDADYYAFMLYQNFIMDHQDEVFAILSGYDGMNVGAIQTIFNRGKLGVIVEN